MQSQTDDRISIRSVSPVKKTEDVCVINNLRAESIMWRADVSHGMELGLKLLIVQ